MKIAYILSCFPQVSETFILDEITSVLRQGVDCHVWSIFRPGDPCMHADAKTLLDDGRVSYYNRLWRFSKYVSLLTQVVRHPSTAARRTCDLKGERAFRRYAANAWSLARQIERYGADVVHAHFAAAGAQYAMAVHCWTGIPFTVTTHHGDIFVSPPDNYSDIARVSESIVCISEHNRNYLKSHFALPPGKLTLVHCGVDPTIYSPQCSDRRPRNGVLRILCVARLAPVKGHHYLFQALSALKNDGVEWELVLAGDGPERKSLESEAAELGIVSQVRFLGFQTQEQVLSLQRASDLFVLPSLSEGIPVSLMEAMACGIPVIATSVRGVPELVINKHTGLLVPPKAPTAIAEAIRWIVEHPEEVEAMTERARQKVVEEFNRERCTEQLIGLWKEAIP